MKEALRYLGRPSPIQLARQPKIPLADVLTYLRPQLTRAATEA